MRGEANQNVPAMAKQAVVGFIVFIANRFFSLSFRVGKHRDSSKERSLRRGIRRTLIANQAGSFRKEIQRRARNPQNAPPKTSKTL